MSGLFVTDRKLLPRIVPRMTGAGFKILVDLLPSTPRPIRIAEVPYHSRQSGESKLDVDMKLEYLFLPLDKLIGNVVPARFVVFVVVGASGVLVHLLSLGLLYRWADVTFAVSQTAATLVAMTSNFLLNNVVTFRDRQLRGWRLLRGLFTFYLACSMGALINVSFADVLHHAGVRWYLAGLSGSAVTSVWNYGVNTLLTWRRIR